MCELAVPVLLWLKAVSEKVRVLVCTWEIPLNAKGISHRFFFFFFFFKKIVCIYFFVLLVQQVDT